MSDITLTYDAGRAQLKGELTFNSVPSVLDCEHLFKDVETLEVDLGGVSRSDSAGLALLVAWVRFAKQHQKTIRFSNVPDQLRAMAGVSGLTEVLSLH